MVLPERVKASFVRSQYTGDFRHQVLDMAELLNNHEAIYTSGERITNTIYIVARQIHQHDLHAGNAKSATVGQERDKVQIV